MIELQILSKVLKEKSMSLLSSNGITEEYFSVYPDEYRYIANHSLEYGNVPDKETFLAKFTDFSFVDVTETDKYLIEAFNEEHLYSLTVPVINKIATLMQTDSREAVEYLQAQLPNLTQRGVALGTNIIADAHKRFDEWEEKKNDNDKFFIPTGFPALDDVLGGWQRGEEFIVLFARTGHGKSWILIKTLEHAWKTGYRVGLIEPEMSASKTGYRFDTLHSNISNTVLNRGYDEERYKTYIDELRKDDNPFFVAHPREFRRRITVSKLRSFVETNKLDILGIDGISYLTDERHERGDSRATALTNISEDLMDLSIDLGIPIIVVVQANRASTEKKDEAPDVENIRDSDGISYNASIILAARQKKPAIEIVVRKNRNGETGGKLLYLWDIDKGTFKYIPSTESETDDTESIQEIKSDFNDGTDVF